MGNFQGSLRIKETVEKDEIREVNRGELIKEGLSNSIIFTMIAKTIMSH